jgi:Zn-dependent M28 family amino/carboxypeptidase
MSLSACQQDTVELPAFDGDKAFQEVERLVAFSPRDAGTPGGHAAANHIANRLIEMGLAVEIDPFSDSTPEGTKEMMNVLAYLPGSSGDSIILGSHFDTMPGIPNFQGANDSGSSTGVLIELARVLKNQSLRHGIIFAFFDGEEGIANFIPGDGLHGSRHYAARLLKEGQLERYRAMILLDMIGDRNLTYTVPANSDPKLLKSLIKAARKLNVREKIILRPHTIITDDHVPFLDINIPAIDLIDFYFGSQENLNDYWHTEKDSLDNISAESLKISGDLTLEMLRDLGAFIDF